MKPGWKQSLLISLVNRHSRPLTKFFISRLSNAADATDLVQEVYLRILRLERPDLIRSPEAYLFTVAAHMVREHNLKRLARPSLIALEDAPPEELPTDVGVFDTASPEDAAGKAERIRRLEQTLAQLSPKARAALLWHRCDGATYEQIGERLGVSKNMVKKYISQALGFCRKSEGKEQE